MLFTEKYPNMKPIKDCSLNIMRGTIKQPCCICGKLTEYIDICYEAYFCSTECQNKMDDDFYDSLATN